MISNEMKIIGEDKDIKHFIDVKDYEDSQIYLDPSNKNNTYELWVEEEDAKKVEEKKDEKKKDEEKKEEEKKEEEKKEEEKKEEKKKEEEKKEEEKKVEEKKEEEKKEDDQKETPKEKRRVKFFVLKNTYEYPH